MNFKIISSVTFHDKQFGGGPLVHPLSCLLTLKTAVSHQHQIQYHFHFCDRHVDVNTCCKNSIKPLTI